MKLVIDRKRWLHGEPGEGALYREGDKKMCCLGFYCAALGVKQAYLEEVGTPCDIDVERVQKKLPQWLFGFNDDDTIDLYTLGADARELVRLNDLDLRPTHIESEAEREAEIARIFAKHGVEVVFEGER